MKREYARRRARLMRRMGPDTIALLPAAPLRVHSRDVHWPHRQDSDFLYLTGFREPEALAALIPGRAAGEFVLFCQKRDPQRERWEGRLAGPAGAVADHGADEAHPVGRIDELLPALLANRRAVYCLPGAQPEFDARLAAWAQRLRPQGRAGRNPPREYRSLEHSLHELRLRKSRTEVALMRRASAAAGQALRRAMAATAPGRFEYELEAELLRETRRRGMEFAYPGIVASGPNACVLHYAANARRLEPGELVLVDSGGMLGDYASDLTRTWPVDGRYTAPQREVYELVLEAQRAAIRRCVPGNRWTDMHRAATRVLTRGLAHLGVLRGDWRKLWKEEAYRPFYMHNTGHWLGMDVHDAGAYRVDGAWRRLEPGMTMTVEPGLYFAPGMRGVPKRFRGVGVRLEDDVAVGRAGPEVLSADLPSEPDEVCRLVGAAAA